MCSPLPLTFYYRWDTLILWEIDATTGEFVDAHDLGYQTLVDVDPKTGAVAYRPGMIPKAGVELEFCPNFGGIRNRMATAYHPETKALYIPITPSCTKGVFSEVERKPHPEGDVYYYENPAWFGWRATGGGPHPLSPDHSGHLIAMDIDSGEILWRHPTATRPLAATLTTGGGLVVSADADRYLFLHDVATGDVLYQTRLPSPVQGYPMTYAVDDKQYLAIPVGGGRAHSARRMRSSSSACRRTRAARRDKDVGCVRAGERPRCRSFAITVQ